jgi:hypothetical protein
MSQDIKGLFILSLRSKPLLDPGPAIIFLLPPQAARRASSGSRPRFVVPISRLTDPIIQSPDHPI